MKKQNKGITLVALVITIIILLILAGVTIRAIFGNDGIIARAKWSAYVLEYESIAEAVEVYKEEKIINKYGEEINIHKIASTDTISLKNVSTESMYPINSQEQIENTNISQTLMKTIMDLEGLEEDEMYNSKKVNLYKVDFSKIDVKAKKEYVINTINGNLYSLQYEEYNKKYYHTPRLGVTVIKTETMKEEGIYEIIVDEGDVVSWDSVKIFYDEFVENSLTCKVYISDDEINWKEENIELVSNDEQEEKYGILSAENTQFLKVKIEIKNVVGKNSKVDYIMVNFYKFKDTEIVPEVTATGAEKKDGIYSIPTSSNGGTEVTGTANVVQKIEVLEDGEFILNLGEVYGNPDTTVKITKADGTVETIEIAGTNKISVTDGATIEVTTELQAGDGIGEIKLLKKNSELSHKKIEGVTKTESEQAEWITVEQNKYVYNNGGTGFWEKCLVNDVEVDETGIIMESEDAVRRIRVRYQTSSESGWSSTFTNIQDAGNIQYLKVIVDYQVKKGNEYGDTSNNKIKVILNDGSWKATFLDEDGSLIGTKRVYFTSSKLTGDLVLPVKEKEGKIFIGWKIDNDILIGGTTYTLSKDIEMIAQYINQDIYTVEELVAFRNAVNIGNTFEGKTINLMNDLDLSSVCSTEKGSWIPIGNYALNTNLCFAGTFEGNNHTINNIYINSSNNDQGLFGIAENATVRNLILGGNVGNYESSYIGILAGKFLSGSIQNVVIGTDSNLIGNNQIGGLVGVISSATTITDSINNAKIDAKGDFIGGICGSNNGKITKSKNYGNIKGNMYVGGIAGWGGIVEQSCNESDTLIEANAGRIGGITGGEAQISYCYNKGDIKGYGDDSTGYTSVGGINGVDGKILHCYNRGTVYGAKGQVAGIKGNGYNDGNGKLQYCYNTGTISGSGRAIGSIVGESYNSNITNCYYTTSQNACGYRGTAENCTKVTDSQLKGENFSNNLGDQWIDDGKKIDENGNIVDNLDVNNNKIYINDGYPILKWQIED